MPNTNVTANDLLLLAIKELENVPKETVFLVKDLFKGYEWNNYPVKVRLLLGTLFLNHIENNDCSIIKIEKTSSNQQKYKKA